MEKEIFKSARYFTVSDFLISHGQLLLRSSKNKEYDSNIDIIFFGVQYVQLFTSLKGLSIRTTRKNLIKYDSVRLFLDSDENNLYEIIAEDQEFYIGASFFKVYENKLDFSETSLGLVENIGREKEIGGSV